MTGAATKPVRRTSNGFLFFEVPMNAEKPRGFTTAILHSDADAGVEHGALHKPLHLSVAYGYRDARDLAAVFQGRTIKRRLALLRRIQLHCKKEMSLSEHAR